jgi:hypothetical protein
MSSRIWAGVDQVILVAQSGRNQHEHVCESLELFAKEVLPDFAEVAEEKEAAKLERLAEACDRAVSRRPPPRVADPGYVVMPQGEPAPARSGMSRGVGPSPRPALRRAGEAALGRIVRGRTDRQIERVVGSRPGLWLVFKAMARSFRPDRALGFQGEIEYDLQTSDGPRPWVIRVEGERAVARPGRSADPALRITTTVPVFARMVAVELPPAKAWMEQQLQIEGDFQIAARLGEMFGQASPW